MERGGDHPSVEMDRDAKQEGHKDAFLRSSSGVGENRETPAKTQPFREECLGACCGCGWFGGDHKPHTVLQPGELVAEDFSQATLYPVPDHGGSYATGNNNGTLSSVITGFQNPHPEEGPVKRKARRPNPRVLVSRTKPRRTRQVQARLGCGVRNGLRPPSAGDACVRADDDGSGWRDRLWSACGHGSRTGVCACAWKVGRCASCRDKVLRNKVGENVLRREACQWRIMKK